jgi:hypothetical protein
MCPSPSDKSRCFPSGDPFVARGCANCPQAWRGADVADVTDAFMLSVGTCYARSRP